MNPYRLSKPSASKTKAGLTAIDLFSGAGGISLGLFNAGFDVALCSDVSAPCELTHRRNFPNTPFERGDVSDLSGARIRKLTGLKRGELDLLIGGPPCQGFSIIGQRETDDPRNRLFREFLRIATELQPRAIVIENVTGLATLGKGAVLAAIAKAFSEAGYTIDCAELLAAQYGVPQMRWRMFFVGWRKDQNKRGGFPLPTHGHGGIGDFVPNRTIPADQTAHFVSIFDAIGDLPPVLSGELVAAYNGKPTTPFQKAMRAGAGAALANHYAPKMSTQNMRRISLLKPGEDWRSLPRELLPPGMQRALRKDHTRRFRRMKWDGVARSIITRFRDPKSGEYIHPDQHRTISIREAARIQSFPDWFVFEGSYSELYDQVGNAVPPLLARAVATELAAMLNDAGADCRAPVKSRYRVPDHMQTAAE
jgi:DNA (cytosine-5)-methyltransferase 1